MPLMTQKAYAIAHRVTPQYIGKLVAEGKILKVGKLIDSRQADQARKAWARAGRVIPAQRSRRSAPRSRSKAAQSPKPAASAEATLRDSATRSLTAARAQREHFGALTAELEYKRASGSLLPRIEVLEAERRKNTNIRTSFRRLARSLAPILARITSPAEAEDTLLREIDLILGQLARDPLGSNEVSAPEPDDSPEAIALPVQAMPAAESGAEAVS